MLTPGHRSSPHWMIQYFRSASLSCLLLCRSEYAHTDCTVNTEPWSRDTPGARALTINCRLGDVLCMWYLTSLPLIPCHLSRLQNQCKHTKEPATVYSRSFRVQKENWTRTAQVGDTQPAFSDYQSIIFMIFCATNQASGLLRSREDVDHKLQCSARHLHGVSVSSISLSSKGKTGLSILSFYLYV